MDDAHATEVVVDMIFRAIEAAPSAVAVTAKKHPSFVVRSSVEWPEWVLEVAPVRPFSSPDIPIRHVDTLKADPNG